MLLVTTWCASLLLDEGKVAQARPLPTDPGAIGSVADLQETSNQLLERLREWYGLHYPELAKTVDDEEFMGLVAEHGDRASMPTEAAASVGGALGPEDRQAVMAFAALARDVARERRRLEAHLEAQV